MPVFPKAQIYKAKVVQKVYLNSITIQVDFEFIEPKEMTFLPGQFFTLKVSDISFRSYSIASSSRIKNRITMIITVAHEGLGSNYCKNLKAGDEVVIVGPSGRFTLPDTLANELLFLATGTGFAPIMSMLSELIDRKSLAKITVYFGLRSEDDIFALDFLDGCKKTLANFDYQICLSNASSNWVGNRGRITDFYKVPNPTTTQAFLCGNPYMVADVIEKLKSLGMPEGNIFHEKFTVASPVKPVQH